MDRHSSVSHAARVARRTSDMPSPHGVGAGSSGSGAHLPLLARAVVLGAPLLLVASQLGQSWCGGHGGVEESAGDKGLHVLLLGVTPWVTVALWRMSTESFVAILRGIQVRAGRGRTELIRTELCDLLQTMALLRASVLLLAQTVCTAAALQQTSPIMRVERLSLLTRLLILLPLQLDRHEHHDSFAGRYPPDKPPRRRSLAEQAGRHDHMRDDHRWGDSTRGDEGDGCAHT